MLLWPGMPGLSPLQAQPSHVPAQWTLLLLLNSLTFYLENTFINNFLCLIFPWWMNPRSTFNQQKHLLHVGYLIATEKTIYKNLLLIITTGSLRRQNVLADTLMASARSQRVGIRPIWYNFSNNWALDSVLNSLLEFNSFILFASSLISLDSLLYLK